VEDLVEEDLVEVLIHPGLHVNNVVFNFKETAVPNVDGAWEEEDLVEDLVEEDGKISSTNGNG